MDSSSNDFGLDLANFDIRDFVREGEANSIFDDQNQPDKLRQQQQQQRSHNQNSNQNLNTGYYGYPPATGSEMALSSPSMPVAPLSLEQLNMLLSMGIGQPNIGQDAGGSTNASLAQADQLKEQLAQQIKLQQLQQLQNQILQQQVCLFSLYC